MKKIFLGIKSIAVYFYEKIKYKKQIELHIINSIRGKMCIDLQGKSKLKIGKFVMSQGPLYIKAVEEAEIIIGDHVFFNHNCSITAVGKVIVGNNVDIANNVVIVDHDHKIDSNQVSRTSFSKSNVVIEDNVWIAANAVITKGVCVGTGAIVAAGAVVTHDVPAHTIVAGVPAKVIKNIT